MFSGGRCSQIETMTTPLDLPATDYDTSDPHVVHRRLADVRGRSPVAFGPMGLEVLPYPMVRDLLRDSRLRSPVGFGLAAQGITSGPLWDRAVKNLMSLDVAEHRRIRRLVARAFTPRAAERFRARCISVISELVDPHLAAGECDIVSDIAREYPIPIICQLLGAPRSDWELFSGWSDSIMKIFSWNVAHDAAEIAGAWDQLDAYLDGLVERRRGALTDDLLSDLIRAEEDGDHLTHDELRSLVAALLFAGTDTTRNQLAAAVHALSGFPAQWSLLAECPELASRAVEELMRHSPVSLGVFRSAVVDLEIGGVLVPAGTFVILNGAAANRDPMVFDHPDVVDITRTDPAPMLSFGGGPHHCLGVHLARVELAEALKVITQRMRNPRRVGPAPWRPMTQMSGPVTLPIAFD